MCSSARASSLKRADEGNLFFPPETHNGMVRDGNKKSRECHYFNRDITTDGPPSALIDVVCFRHDTIGRSWAARPPRNVQS